MYAEDCIGKCFYFQLLKFSHTSVAVIQLPESYIYSPPPPKRLFATS